MTKDELRENVRCSLFDEQDTDAVMADVDRYVEALLQQTPCTAQLSPVKDFKCANCDFTCNTLESLSWHKAECVWARIAWYDKAWGWFGF